MIPFLIGVLTGGAGVLYAWYHKATHRGSPGTQW